MGHLQTRPHWFEHGEFPSDLVRLTRQHLENAAGQDIQFESVVVKREHATQPNEKAALPLSALPLVILLRRRPNIFPKTVDHLCQPRFLTR